MEFKVRLGQYGRSKSPLSLKLLKRSHFAIPTTQMTGQSCLIAKQLGSWKKRHFSYARKLITLVYAAIYVDQPKSMSKLIPVSDCLANSQQNESFKIGNTMSITHGRKRPYLSTAHVNSEIIIRDKIMYSRNHDTNIQVIKVFSLLIIAEWAQVIYKNKNVIRLNHFGMIVLKYPTKLICSYFHTMYMVTILTQMTWNGDLRGRYPSVH